MAKMKKKTKIIIAVIVCVVIVVAAVIGMASARSRAMNMAGGNPMMAMLRGGGGTTELERVDLTNTVSVSGNVRSANVKKVYLEASGAGKATQVNVKVGDYVEVGDVLCVFDTETLQKEYDKAKLQADQSAERAEITLKGAQNTYSSGKITQDQAVRTAQDNVDAMQDRLDDANEAYLDAVEAYNKGELVATLETDYNYTMAEYNYKTTKNDLQTLLELQTTAESEYNGLPDGEAKDEAEQALNLVNSQVAAKQRELDSARATMDAARELFESKEVDAESVLDDYREAVADAEEALASAQQRLDETDQQRKLSLSSYAQNIDTAEIGTDMTVTEMGLEDALENIAKCTITAPVAGTVTAVYVTEDEMSAAGSMLFIIEDLNDLEIKTTVKEYDIADITVGMPVVVKSDATGNTAYEGTVEEIGVTAQKDARGDTIQASTAEFDITISVKPGDGRLKVGMNGRATITVGGKEDALAVLYSALGYDADGSAYVYVGRPNDEGSLVATKVYVQTGLETDYEVEVISDELKEGDMIVDDPETVVEGQIISKVG